MNKFIVTHNRIENYIKNYEKFAICPNDSYKDAFNNPLRCPHSLQHIDNPPVPCLNDNDFNFCTKYKKNTIQIQKIIQKDKS